MRIISLNIWGGRAGKEGVLSFFTKYRDETDIFCLQEVWAGRFDDYEGRLAGGVPISQSNIMTEALRDISEQLPNHTGYFRPSFLESYGIAMFVRNGLEVIEEGDAFVHQERGFVPEDDIGHHARNLQYLRIKREDQELAVMHIHALWNGKGKGDCAERIEQSARILEFTKSLDCPFALLGDFNLTPDTESLKMLENAGLHNLVREYGITSTRTSLYTKPERYADYAFVSEGIEVKDFKVLPDEVSDHAALFLELV